MEEKVHIKYPLVIGLETENEFVKLLTITGTKAEKLVLVDHTNGIANIIEDELRVSNRILNLFTDINTDIESIEELIQRKKAFMEFIYRNANSDSEYNKKNILE